MVLYKYYAQEGCLLVLDCRFLGAFYGICHAHYCQSYSQA